MNRRLSLIKLGIIIIVLGILITIGAIFLPVLFWRNFNINSIQFWLALLGILSVLGNIFFWGGIIVTIVGVVRHFFHGSTDYDFNQPMTGIQMNLTASEQEILNYIKDRGNKIRLSECANELQRSENDIINTLKSLEQKGIMKEKKKNV